MSGGQVWAVIALSTAATVAIKAVGPVALGGRDLPGSFVRVITLMAPVLLAALIATQALADGSRIHVGPDTAGVVVAALAAWRGVGVLLVVVIAAATTAGLRAAGL